MLESVALVIFIIAVYLIPSIIADTRGHKNKYSIYVINIFLGWTLIVYIICLAWAFSGNVESGD